MTVTIPTEHYEGLIENTAARYGEISARHLKLSWAINENKYPDVDVPSLIVTATRGATR